MAECGEISYVPEDVEVTFSPVIDCLVVSVEGESKEGCGGAEIAMINNCPDPVVFAGWSFTCNGATCNSIPAGQQGTTPIDIEQKEEATFTFDGSLGLEPLQVVVKMTVDEQSPGCAVGGAGLHTTSALPVAVVVALLGLRRVMRLRFR
jgi:hypothetical protein